jgi:hypothetical protein
VSTRYSCQILINLSFLDRFSKNPPISDFMEIRPVRIEFYHADTRLTDRRADRGTDDEANSRFSQFCELA